MYPVEFASETVRHTLDLSTAQSKSAHFKCRPFFFCFDMFRTRSCRHVSRYFCLSRCILHHASNLWGHFPAVTKAAPLTRHQSSGSVSLSVAVSQGSAVVRVLRLTLTDQLRHKIKVWSHFSWLTFNVIKKKREKYFNFQRKKSESKGL